MSRASLVKLPELSSYNNISHHSSSSDDDDDEDDGDDDDCGFVHPSLPACCAASVLLPPPPLFLPLSASSARYLLLSFFACALSSALTWWCTLTSKPSVLPGLFLEDADDGVDDSLRAAASASASATAATTSEDNIPWRTDKVRDCRPGSIEPAGPPMGVGWEASSKDASCIRGEGWWSGPARFAGGDDDADAEVEGDDPATTSRG